jgi:hypothetical protein
MGLTLNIWIPKSLYLSYTLIHLVYQYVRGGLGTDWARAGTGYGLGTSWARTGHGREPGTDWAQAGHALDTGMRLGMDEQTRHGRARHERA